MFRSPSTFKSLATSTSPPDFTVSLALVPFVLNTISPASAVPKYIEPTPLAIISLLSKPIPLDEVPSNSQALAKFDHPIVVPELGISTPDAVVRNLTALLYLNPTAPFSAKLA